MLSKSKISNMSTNRTLDKIGRTLRDESGDIVDARLPERIHALLRKLALADSGDELLARNCGASSPERR
jgi:hypothetical protein